MICIAPTLLRNVARATACAVVCAVVLGFACAHAQNLPTGPVLTSGQASVSTNGANSMTIRQASPRASLDWDSFSIGPGRSVDILQAAGRSAVLLNRVTGGTPSAIFGSLRANGQVFLVNPAGVLFAPGASVDVGALVASTLDWRTADFKSGRGVLSNPGSSAELRNAGNLSARDGIVLIGPRVSNAGQLLVDGGGNVILAAGDRVTLNLADSPLSVRIDGAALQASITHGGSIVTEGGQVILAARSGAAALDTVINSSGVIRASRIDQQGGSIVLDAGASGGTVLSGRLEARGTGTTARGGSVQVLGASVALEPTARIDVAGGAGSGQVLIGGAWRGAGPQSNAMFTRVEQGASIDASATVQGDGGSVVVWADDTTRFAGDISARGGPAGGNGGQVEVSGRRLLDYSGRVDALAPAGITGALLLDPKNICIAQNAANDACKLLAASRVNPYSVFYVDGINAAKSAVTLEATDTIVFRVPGQFSALTDKTSTLAFNSGKRILASGMPIATGGASLSLTAPDMSLSDLFAGAGQISINNSGTAHVGAVNGAALVKQGNGTLWLDGAGGWGGTAVVQAGVLNLGAAGSLADTPLEIWSGATVGLNGRDSLIASLRGGNGGAGTMQLNNSTLVINPGVNVTGSFGGSLLGAGKLVKQGRGAQVLLGASLPAVSGVTLSDGDLTLGNVTGNGLSKLLVSGGTLNLGGTTLNAGNIALSSGNINNGRLVGTSFLLLSGQVSASLAAAAGSNADVMKGGAGVLVMRAGASGLTVDAPHIVVSEGTLALDRQVSTVEPQWTLPQINVLSGASLDLRNVSIGAPVSLASGATLLASQGDAALSGTVRLVNASLSASSASALTLSANDNVFDGGTRLTGGGAFSLNAGPGGIQLSSAAARSLTVNTVGAITQTGALTVGGDASFVASGPTAAVTLGQAQNSFAGTVTVNASAASLRASGNLTADLTTTGATSASASGTLVARLRGSGASTLTAGASAQVAGSASSLNVTAPDVVLGFAGTAATVASSAKPAVETTVSGRLNVTALGSVSQLARLSVVGDTAVRAADVRLKDAANMLGGMVSILMPVNNIAPDVALRNATRSPSLVLPANLNSFSLTYDAAPFVLPALNVSSNLAIDASAISQASGAALVVGRDASFVAGNGGGIALDNIGNQFRGKLGLEGGVVSVLDGAGDLNLGRVAVASLTARATQGNITQSMADGEAITVRGASQLLAGSGDIVLGHRGNDFQADLSLTGQRVQIKDRNALRLSDYRVLSLDVESNTDGASNAAGVLSLGRGTVTDSFSAVTHGDRITRVGSNTLSVGGALTLNSMEPAVSGGAAERRGAIDLGVSNAANIFGGLVSLKGGAARLRQVGDLILGPLEVASLDVAITRSVDANTGQKVGSISLGQGRVGGPLTVVTDGGALRQSGALWVSGAASLNATGAVITLDQAGNRFDGSVALTGGATRITSKGLQLGDVAVTSLRATAGDSGLQLGHAIIRGDLALTTTDGAISQLARGSLDVAGSTQIDSGNAMLTLGNSGNRFVGPLEVLSAGTTSLRADSSLSVVLRTGGATEVRVAGGSDRVLSVSAAGGGVSGALRTVSSGVTEFDVTRVGGDLDVTSAGTIRQVNPALIRTTLLTVGGASTFRTDALAGSIELDARPNNLAGPVRFATTPDASLGNVALRVNSGVAPGLRFDADPARLTLVFDKTGVELPNLHVRGDFVLNTNGAVTQGIGTNIKVDGNASFNAQTNDITLNQSGNDFVGSVSLKGGSNVELSDINALVLASEIDAHRLHVESHGDLNLGSGSVDSDLVAKSNGGLVHQTGALTLFHVGRYDHLIDAGSGDVLLDQVNNLFYGALAVRGAAVTLVNGRALNLQLAALGNTEVRTAADLSVVGTVGGTSQASNLSLTSRGRTTFGAASTAFGTVGTTVWGDLSVNARLGVTRNGPLAVAGHSDVAAQSQDSDLSDPANDPVGLLALDTHDTFGSFGTSDEARGSASIASVASLRLDPLSVASLELIASGRAGPAGVRRGRGHSAGRLNAASHAGNIVQASGQLDISAGAKLNVAIADSGLADTVDITPLDVANRLAGTLRLRGRTVKMYDDIDLLLGAVLLNSFDTQLGSGIAVRRGGSMNSSLTATHRGKPVVRHDGSPGGSLEGRPEGGPEGGPDSSRVTAATGQSAPLSILDPMPVPVFSGPDPRHIVVNDPRKDFRGLMEMHSLITPRP